MLLVLSSVLPPVSRASALRGPAHVSLGASAVASLSSRRARRVGFFVIVKLYWNLKHVPEGLDVKPPTAIAAHV